MKKLAASGMGVIIISDEVQEVIHNCHRVLIMDGGRIIHEFFPDEVSEKKLLEDFNLA
jgi:simple sugar transport system ATP-binding protein